MEKQKPIEHPGRQSGPRVRIADNANNAAKAPPSANHPAAGLETILAIEDRVRAAENENELFHLIANEARKISAARQVVVVQWNVSGAFRVVAVSSLALVERDTPFVRWIEEIIGNLDSDHGLSKSVEFELPAFADPKAAETASYPFRHVLWQPMCLRTGEVFAGLLLARERPWTASDKQLVLREAGVFSIVWQSLSGPAKLRPVQKTKWWYKPAIAAGFLIAAFIPVPMTTLAPVEIIAADPRRVTAPIEGVIKEILVEPNQRVKKGQRILVFDDTELSNQFKVTTREMNVAESRHDRSQQAAFSEESARHELAITLNEFRLKSAERDFAAAQLAKTVITADRDGVLIYNDKDELIGSPVKTGQQLMQIADPRDIAARIELAVADAIVLEKGASVKLFLDASPLSSLTATLETTAYQAEPNSTQQLVYRLTAGFGSKKPKARIGARGTAQLTGDRVPFIYFLLRRPIAATRQYIGF